MFSRLYQRSLTILFAVLFAFGSIFQSAVPTVAEDQEADITEKVVIDSITSPNAEVKDSTDVNDFTSAVEWQADVEYKMDLTIDKGTPIKTGDFVDIPVTADRGELYETAGISVLDSEDGSLLGEATITKGKIHIKFTKNDNTKTAVKLTISTTLRRVGALFGGFYTQEEVDAALAANPTGIDKVKILNKNANINVKSYYYLESRTNYYDVYPEGTIRDPLKFFNLYQAKNGNTSSSNTNTEWGVLWNSTTYLYDLTAPSDGKSYETEQKSSIIAALLFGYDKVFGSFSATETSYFEDTLPGDIYIKILNYSMRI